MKKITIFILIASFFISFCIVKNSAEKNAPEGKKETINTISTQVDSIKRIDTSHKAINSIGVLVWKQSTRKPVLFYSGQNHVKDSIFFTDISKKIAKPFAFHLDYDLLVLKCLAKEGKFYKVLVNEDTGEYFYIALDDSSFKYQTWEEHIVSNVFSVDITDKSNLLESPTKNGVSCQGINWEDVFLKPIMVKNEWLKVMWEDEKKNKRYGWIKWKDGNKLLIEFFYFA